MSRGLLHGTPKGFTISESAHRGVLTRLPKLNHEHYAEEVKAGLHEKKGKKRTRHKRTSGRRKKTDKNQLKLL